MIILVQVELQNDYNKKRMKTTTVLDLNFVNRWSWD